MGGVKACFGQGKYRIEAAALFCGEDVALSVWGGTGPHVGAAALAVYEPLRDSATVSVITAHGHRDDKVASHFAKAVSREMKCTVSACAGIHIDDAGAAELEELWNNSLECCAELIKALKAGEGI